MLPSGSIRCGAIATIVCLSLAACTTVRPLDPDSPELELQADEGILALHVDTDVELTRIQLAGVGLIEIASEVPKGEHLILVAMTPGTYHWSRLVKTLGIAELYADLSGDDLQSELIVEPGKTNYAGLLRVREINTFALDIYTLNRSSMALTELEERYPDLLERFPMRYAGERRDDFLRHYRAARAMREDPSP